MPAPFHTALIVANPIAGRGRGEGAARELSQGLAQRGIANEVHFTRGPGDARLFLRELTRRVDLVVAVGGDGTVSEVLDGLVDRTIPVAILPMGTANVMSLDLGLPRDVDGALEMIVAGHRSALDTAHVNGRHLSFLVVGVGFDAMVVHDLEAHRNGPITKATWIGPAWRSFRDYTPPELSVEIDGERANGTFGLVLVSNIVHYGGFRVLAHDRAIHDGLFEVYLFESSSRLALVGYLLRGLTFGFPGRGCRRVRARRVRITSSTAVPCQIDGEARGTTPIELEVNSLQHTLVIPAHARERASGGAVRANSAL